MNPIDRVIGGLERANCNPRPSGGGWKSRCPAHDGRAANLTIKEAADGTVLLNCFHADESGRSCTAEAIVGAIDLTMADLFPSVVNGSQGPRRAASNGQPKARTFPTAEQARSACARHLGKPTARWTYQHADGSEAFQVVRFDRPGETKQFRPLHRSAEGWRIADPAGPLPLYKLPEVVEAGTVFVAEGEKCADLARGLGLVATTSAHGCKSVAKTDWSPMAGKTVVILPDHDAPGEGYAAKLVAHLATLSPRPVVKVVPLPGLANEGDDLEQWLELRDSRPTEAIRDELLALADQAAPIDLDSVETRADPSEVKNVKNVGVTLSETGDEDAIPVPVQAWPAPPEDAAYYGVMGEIVQVLAEHTEADPFGLLSQEMVMFGNVVGRGPRYMVEDTWHGANEYVLQVGQTSLGRKGTSTARSKALFEQVDGTWLEDRVRGGLSSGEGLIAAVRDPTIVKQAVKENGRVVGYQDVMTDAGVDDKRLLIIESEFGGVLRVLEREGNKLSALLRQGWDGGDLNSLTKNPLHASHTHISIIGHVTMDELLSHMSNIELVNGLANRFLFVAVRRAKVLPFGGCPRRDLIEPLIIRLQEAVEFARGLANLEMTKKAKELWEPHYRELTTPPPGRLGTVVSRAAPHVCRLSLQYALADKAQLIDEKHLAAALAFWRASYRCAAFIFGDDLGNRDADRIIKALRATPAGLTRTEIRVKVFQGNARAEQIPNALAYLLRHGLISEKAEDTAGRRAQRYHVTSPILRG